MDIEHAPDSFEAPPESSPPPSRLGATWATMRTRATALRCLLAGVAVWLITLMPVLTFARSSGVSKVAAVLALCACVGGSLLVTRDPRAARLVGLTGFVALALAAWLASGGALAIVDSFRGLLGVLAWAIYAASWSHPWSVADARLRDAPLGGAFGLRPRRESPRFALAVAGAGTVAALGCLALAWRIDDPARAVFAQALASAAAITLVSGSSALAAALGRDERPVRQRWPIDRRVVRTLFVFALVAGAMVALEWMR